MKSALFSLGWKDIIKCFILAVFTAFVTGVYEAIQAGNINFTWAFWQPIIYTAIGSGLAYFIKNFFTNSKDQFATTENPK